MSREFNEIIGHDLESKSNRQNVIWPKTEKRVYTIRFYRYFMLNDEIKAHR